MGSTTLDTVPQEVLEHIAFYLFTHQFLGPPSALLSLVMTNRRIHSQLSVTSTPHVYARVFAHKFDIAPAIRRLGPDRTTPCILARELQVRCFLLKRMRMRLDSIVQTSALDNDAFSLQELLFHAYLMMLENEGKNEKQLREYAGVEGWLREYWFTEKGASRAIPFLNTDRWLPESPEVALAMWLFWFLLRPGISTSRCFHFDVRLTPIPGDYTKDDTTAWTALNVLKILALAAHKVCVINNLGT